MYKKITHNIVEEHFDRSAVVPMSMRQRLLAKLTENEEDVIKVNVPLMLRLLEWAREEAWQDTDLHTAVERLIELSEGGDVLTMSNYPEIVQGEENSKQGE